MTPEGILYSHIRALLNIIREVCSCSTREKYRNPQADTARNESSWITQPLNRMQPSNPSPRISKEAERVEELEGMKTKTRASKWGEQRSCALRDRGHMLRACRHLQEVLWIHEGFPLVFVGGSWLQTEFSVLLPSLGSFPRFFVLSYSDVRFVLSYFISLLSCRNPFVF